MVAMPRPIEAFMKANAEADLNVALQHVNRNMIAAALTLSRARSVVTLAVATSAVATLAVAA